MKLNYQLLKICTLPETIIVVSGFLSINDI